MGKEIVTTVVCLLVLFAATFVSYQGGCVVEGMLLTQAQIKSIQQQLIIQQDFLGGVTYEADRQLARSITELDYCLTEEVEELKRIGRDDIDLEVVARVHTQVVRIVLSDGSGSGVILEGGRILTCAHIFMSGTEGRIELTDGRCYDFTSDQVTIHGDLDLSIIDLGIDLGIEGPELRYAVPVLGEETIVAGNPKGGGTFAFNTVTFGRITGLNRHIPARFGGGMWRGIELIQTDAPIEGGNSGGPMFDRDGKLIGIVVAKYPGTDGMGWAVPIEYVLELFGRL